MTKNKKVTSEVISKSEKSQPKVTTKVSSLGKSISEKVIFSKRGSKSGIKARKSEIRKEKW